MHMYKSQVGKIHGFGIMYGTLEGLPTSFERKGVKKKKNLAEIDSMLLERETSKILNRFLHRSN